MTIRLNGLRVTFKNPIEFLFLYQQVFKSKDYYFLSAHDSPLIIDCGAHIGLSVLYFKKLYPKAKIIAFEPDPEIFKLLQKNVSQNRLSDVHCINAALASKRGKIPFFKSFGLLSWSWGSSGEEGKFLSKLFYKKRTVNAARLSAFINETVDFLKLDIEGMEGEVLLEIENKLRLIKQIFIEFHRVKESQINKSSIIIDLLKRSGFKINIKMKSSFVSHLILRAKDEPFRLNVFAENPGLNL